MPVDLAAQPTFVTQTVDSIGDVGWQTSIAIDGNGYPHIGYIAPPPLTDLKYARKTGSGWSVETASGTCNPLSATNLVLDAGDNPAMATGINEALYVFKDGAGWTSEVIGGFATWYASMALDNNGVPRVLYNWSVYKEAYSRVAYSIRIGTDLWVESTIGSGPFTPSAPVYKLVFDSDNYRHIAYISTNGDTLRYSYNSSTVTIYEKFTRASYCDINVDQLDNPYIAYYDYEQADLILLVRNGLSWTSTPVDQAGNVGKYCSLALGDDGSCHIAYYDADNGDLKYAGRTGPAEAWDIQVIDSAGDVGLYTSITLDDAGRPHIAYYDASNGDLEYATFSPFVPVQKTTWGALKALMDKR
jgi:hypothetical protein